MENDSYLIPSNAKRSTLILGWFTPLDLIIFSIGASFTLIMLLIIGSSTDFLVMILIILPALTATTLVLPVPYYHNVMQLLINIYNFYFSKRNYKWKGWCILDEHE